MVLPRGLGRRQNLQPKTSASNTNYRSQKVGAKRHLAGPFSKMNTFEPVARHLPLAKHFYQDGPAQHPAGRAVEQVVIMHERRLGHRVAVDDDAHLLSSGGAQGFRGYMPNTDEAIEIALAIRGQREELSIGSRGYE